MGSRFVLGPMLALSVVLAYAGCGPAPEATGEASALRAPYHQEAELFGDAKPSPVGFGSAVAVSGHLVAASAPHAETSAVHLFRRHAGTWIAEARLVHPQGLPGTGFGRSLALDDRTLLVGTPWEGAGAVYVFERFPGRWVLRQRLQAGSAGGGDFGRDVALRDGTALVGAPGEAGGGAAYVFVKGRGGFRESARLTGGGEGAGFGTSVALHGRTAVVGAPGEPGSGGEPLRGSAHVFRGHGSRWHEEAVLCPGDATPLDAVGASVAASEDLVVVGNDLFRPAAHVFRRTPAGWAEEGALVPAGSEPTGGYGHVVAASGDLVVVGAPWNRHASTPNAGQVFVFSRAGGAWTQLELLDSDDPRTEAEGFGHAVAIDGHTVVVGAPRDDEHGLDAGAAYVFRLR